MAETNSIKEATNVLEWLEASSERLPDKCAVAGPVADGSTASLSFSELRDAAQRFGSWLASRVEPRSGIAFYLEKTPEALAAMLGCVYAGCFYSVIDVRQTPNRVASICSTLEPAFIFTDDANAAAAAELFCGPLFADAPREAVLLSTAFACEPDADALARVRAQAKDTDALYVNFTSGSTGTPKGVIVPHRGVLDFISCFVETFGLSESDVHGNQAPFDFDVSVKDIYTCLLTGGTIRLIPRSYFTRPTDLMDYLADTGVTTLIWAVSAMTFVSIMNGFGYRVPTGIRRVMFSGEVMPPKQLRVWQRALPDARFVNLYGPTEITCNCTFYELTREYADDETIPMGRAFASDDVFLLATGSDSTSLETGADGDAAASERVVDPSEADVPGELCVAGTTLATGYLGNPEKTAEAFVADPRRTGDAAGSSRIYRTGDIARYNAEGDLVYVGRKDNQIKHLGQRIELGDIEATANGVTGVEQSCCLYNPRRKRIVLFYVGGIEKDALVESLRERLPQYMVPNSTTKLEALPLNKNGKVDRTLLAEQAGIKR